MATVLEISPLADDEIGRLFGLAKCCFEAAAGWNDRRVLDSLARDVVFVAHEDGEVAGYIALRPDRERVIVEQVLVAPGHEQRGIGHRLLEHAEGYAIATRARAVDIVVEADNWRARSFYRRLGFLPVQTELLELTLPSPG
jgi:ribosomal protein S18 acetylase RimI-like enzyme